MSHLRDLRRAFKDGRTLYRENWPQYAGWYYDPTASLNFISREVHREFWFVTMADSAMLPGIPAGLTVADINADDWKVLY